MGQATDAGLERDFLVDAIMALFDAAPDEVKAAMYSKAKDLREPSSGIILPLSLLPPA